MTEEHFTIEGARDKVDAFERDLAKMVPNPRQQRLLDLDKDYTEYELQGLLQKFGSYLATLDSMEGKMESECHLLKEGLKSGVAVLAAKSESKEKTITAREAEVLADSSGLRVIRKWQIENEACLLALKGWRRAYEDAYAATSRIISLRVGELSLQTGIRSGP